MFMLGTLKMRLLFIMVFYVLWNISADCMEQNLKNRDKRKIMVYEDQWLVQKLDHFNPNDKRTWKQVIIVLLRSIVIPYISKIQGII